MIVLDERLALIAKQVRSGSVVADIGADHGYLAAWLVESGRCPTAFATDLREGPLSAARETVQRSGVAERVKLVLSDGLDALSPTEVDDIVIAGMGGDLIIRILARSGWKNPAQCWHLQPMTRASALRQWLCGAGFTIQQEHATHAGRFWYTVLTVSYTGVVQPCSPLFAAAGLLPQTGDAMARGYLEWQAKVALARAEGLARSHNPTAEALEAYRLHTELLHAAERCEG